MKLGTIYTPFAHGEKVSAQPVELIRPVEARQPLPPVQQQPAPRVQNWIAMKMQ